MYLGFKARNPSVNLQRTYSVSSFQLQPVDSGEQQGLWRQRDDTILRHEGLVWFFLLLLLFEAGSHDVPQAGLILTYAVKNDITHLSRLVILPSDAGGIGMHHHTWFRVGLGFKPKASRILGEDSTDWATPGDNVILFALFKISWQSYLPIKMKWESVVYGRKWREIHVSRKNFGPWLSQPN